MSEFEHTTQVEASPDNIWNFVADVRNLPKYLPTTHSAEPAQGERVEVKGEAQGHEYDSEGYFRKDRENRRLEWGADEGYYSGWLEISGRGVTSEVTVHLSFTGAPPHGEGDPPGDTTSEDAPSRDDVHEGLVSALESIKNFVEGDRPDIKDESRAATYGEQRVDSSRKSHKQTELEGNMDTDKNAYDRRNPSSGDRSENDQRGLQSGGIAGVVVGVALVGVSAYLIYRSMNQQGRSASSDSRSSGKTKRVRESVTVNKPAAELYHYWRHLSNLGEIMSHLESVTEQTSTRSHWVAKGPAGIQVEWDAEITQDTENQLIAWRAVEDADVQNEGSVTFTEALGGRGTEVRVDLRYEPPGGKLGEVAATLFGEEPSQQLSDDLRRFKQRMETGVTATTQGQPRGN